MARRNVFTEEVLVNQLESKTIIAVSDVHLGQREKNDKSIEYCNKSTFYHMVEQIKKKDLMCDYFIICGDFLDMWRRDMVGVVFENADIFHLLKEVKDIGVEIKFIVGNHDYYLRHILEKYFGYEFSFYQGISLVDDTSNTEYMFVHGDEFDDKQDESFYDALCFSNDNVGDFMDSVWNFFLKNRNWLKRLWDYLRKGRIMKFLETLLDSAEKRFTDTMMVRHQNTYILPTPIPKVEQEAINFAKNTGKLLVFGHTHQPFLHVDLTNNIRITNTGTWVNLSSINSTFISIANNVIKLWKYGELTPLDTKLLK